MLRLGFLLILFLTSSPLGMVHGEDASQRFEVKTDVKFAEEPPRVGSNVTYTVKIEWWGTDDRAIKLIPPDIETKGLEITNTGVSTESEAGENGKVKQIRSFVFDLVPTRKGEVRIEPFPIEYIEQGIPGTKQLEVPGRTFKVKAAPLQIPWLWIGGGTGGILVMALTLFAILKIRKRKREKKIEEDPHAVVLAKISVLDPLITNGEYPEYVAKLAREFSIYLKDVLKLESTDFSVVEKNQDLSREDKKLLVKIIEAMTELKYSKEALSPSEVKDVKRLVEQFIESKKTV